MSDGNAAATAALFEEIDEAFAESLSAARQTPTHITCQIESVLLPEDIAGYLDEHGNLTTTQKADERDIRLLRERHHSVARYLAQDIPESVVATITGYTAKYISDLKTNPAMIELIGHYRAPGNFAARQIGETLKRVAGMSLERLEEKIEGDELSASELTAVAKLGYDRSGHGPASSTHNITEHHIIDHGEIVARHREAKRRDADIIINPEDVREALPKLPAPSPKEGEE